jgi:two-component sensor histidine kinase
MTLEDLYRLLCSGHVQTQGIVDTIQSPLVVLDGNLRIAGGNKAFYETFQLNAEAATGTSVFALGNGQWNIPELRRLLDDIIPKSSAIVGYELSGELPGKGQRNLLINARRLAHPDNNSPNLLLEIEDITERRRAAATKDILLEETRHRMRNLLAIVRSLANQTRTQGRNAEDYRAAFLGRLETVLHAQEFGGAEVADLQTLVSRALAPAGPARLRLQGGPKVDLSGPQVLPINLILHELATNAVKYGALSVDHGIVHVGWKVVDGDGRADGKSDGKSNGKGDGHDAGGRTLQLLWREEGGPLVAAPTALGFGTRLIQFSAGGDLGGKAELEFDSQGLRAQISATLK